MARVLRVKRFVSNARPSKLAPTNVARLYQILLKPWKDE